MTRNEPPHRASSPKRPKAARDERPAPPATEAPAHQRIAKLMARVGLCSRRDAEAWILDGRVSVNGVVLTSPALDVGPDDSILVDDMPLPQAEKTRLFLFHKPRGLVTSDHDPEGRPTVTDFLRENWPDGPRVVTIGRLDINTEGLLLLTNDGGLARVLELPQTGWVRRYRVRAKGETDQAQLDALYAGITIDGIDYAGIEAKLDRVQGSNCWLTMGLREGKNREIKRVLEHLGLEVNRLIRLSFGPFQLLDLHEGAVEEVKMRVLRDQLGETLAAQAGVDLDGPADGLVRDEPAPRRAERAPERRREAPSTERPTPGRDRDRREPRDAEETPLDKPERPHGPRRHVSALRAEERAAPLGPRKRIDRSEVRAGKDRKVVVERHATVGRAASSDDRGTRPSASKGERRHTSPSALGKQERMRRSGGESARPEGRRFDEKRPPRDDRAPGPRGKAVARGGERPLTRDRRADAAERGRPETRPAGGEFGDRLSARPRSDRPRTEMPLGDRPFRDKPRGDRPNRDRSTGDRPARGGDSRDERRNGPRPARKPRSDKPFGDKPRGDEPRRDRPAGDRSARANSPRDERRSGPRPDGKPSRRPSEGRTSTGRPVRENRSGPQGAGRPGRPPAGAGPRPPRGPGRPSKPKR